MEDGLKPYPEYKESKLPWLGSIPSHWEEKRAKYFYREADERSVTGQQELLSVSHVTGVTPRSQKNVTMFMAESYAGHKLCRPGDLVINTMWAWMAALGVAKQTGIVSPSYGVYRPLRSEALVPEYADALLRTKPYQAEYVCRSTGIRGSRLRLYPDNFLDIPIACPPYDEQRCMIAFLNRRDRDIRRFVRNKRRLIEVLNEQRNQIVQAAVSHSDEREFTRLKYLLRGPLTNGLFKKKDQYGSGIRLVNVQDIYQDDFRVRAETLERVRVSDDESSVFSAIDGDVFFVRSSLKLEGTGRAAYMEGSEEPAVYECHLVRGRPNVERVIPRFLAYYLNSLTIRNYIVARANTVTMSTIGQGVISALPIMLPTVERQKQILAEIDDQTATVALAAARAQRQIELMREYRARIIADVVTGKLDVRHLALTVDSAAQDLDGLTENGILGQADESTPEEAAEEVEIADE